MFYSARRFLNILTMLLLVLSAISAGIWGIFRIQILPALMGETLSRGLYCIMGLFGMYGCHLFMEIAKDQLEALRKRKSSSDYEVCDQRSYEE